MTGSFDSTEVEVTVTIPHHALPPGEPRIWVRGRDSAGNWGPASSRAIAVNGDPLAADVSLPVRFALEQNAPNPIAGGRTAIRYALPHAGRVELTVYGVRGEKVRTLVSEYQTAGSRLVAWDRRDGSGRKVPSGVYFYRLEAGRERAERKMVVLD